MLCASCRTKFCSRGNAGYNACMESAAVWLILQGYWGSRGSLFDLPHGPTIYFAVIACVSLVLLVPKLRNWFGQPRTPEDRSPLKPSLSGPTNPDDHAGRDIHDR